MSVRAVLAVVAVLFPLAVTRKRKQKEAAVVGWDIKTISRLPPELRTLFMSEQEGVGLATVLFPILSVAQMSLEMEETLGISEELEVY